MAVPKYRKSKSKKRHRVAQWEGVEEPTLGECENCGISKPPHQVCMECGYYRGEKVIDVGSESA
ncbi:MAG: 50S ribosomal protein L32 [bacterium]